MFFDLEGCAGWEVAPDELLLSLFPPSEPAAAHADVSGPAALDSVSTDGALTPETLSRGNSHDELAAVEESAAVAQDSLFVVPLAECLPVPERHIDPDPAMPVVDEDEWGVVPLGPGWSFVGPEDIGVRIKTAREPAWRELCTRLYTSSKYLIRVDLEGAAFESLDGRLASIELLNASTMNAVPRAFAKANSACDVRLASDGMRVSAVFAVRLATHSFAKKGAQFRFRLSVGGAFDLVTPKFAILARRPDGEQPVPVRPRKRSREEPEDERVASFCRFVEDPNCLSHGDRRRAMREMVSAIRRMAPDVADRIAHKLCV